MIKEIQMSKNKCPKCGSKNTKIYSEDCVLNKKKRIEIDEKSISIRGIPFYYCESCKKEFGYPCESLLQKTSYICVDTFKKDRVSQTIIFSKTSMGATIEGPFLCYYPDLPEIYINHDEWFSFLKQFYQLYILDWESQEIDEDSLYEFGWNLKIKCDDEKSFEIQGQNAYPPYWDKLMDLFVQFKLPNIKNKLGQNFL
jgi:DNA-directed RNA polymerase subunit RPC12/RpoP